MGMPVAPAVPIHQPPLVDDDFAREFRRGIDRVVEAMEGLGDDETLQALLHQLRTLERRPLAKVGFALSVALYATANTSVRPASDSNSALARTPMGAFAPPCDSPVRLIQ